MTGQEPGARGLQRFGLVLIGLAAICVSTVCVNMVMSRKRGRSTMVVSVPRYAKRVTRGPYIPRSLPMRVNNASFGRMTENKFVDISPTFAVTAGSQYNINLLNGISVGSDLYNRVGRSVFMKNIKLAYQFHNIDTSLSTTDIEVRVLVVLDKAPNGAALPVLADFLRELNAAGAASTTLRSHINTNNRQRFQILHDKRPNLPPWNVTNTNSGVPTISISEINVVKTFKLPKKMQFSGTGSVISDIQTYAVYLVMAHDYAGVNTPWQMQAQARCEFTDI